MSDKGQIVLLVEDNPQHAEIILRLLHKGGIFGRIFHVSDGETALEYLFRQGVYADPVAYPRPQLVLLDLRLPRVDGLEVLERVKSSEDLRTLPVVVLSSSEAEQDIAAAYRRHANSYLVKPIDFKKFAMMIETLAFYWLTLNRHCRS